MLAVFFPLTFGTFRYFPGAGALYEFWFIVCAAYLLVGFALWNRREGRKATVGEWYIIALAVLVPVISAIAAWSAFGQPLIYGILAQRKLAVLAAVLFYGQSLRKGIFTLRESLVALLALGWVTLALNILIRALLKPASFADVAGIGFVSGPGPDAFFHLPGEFITFNLIYYALRGFRTGRPIYYLLCLILFADNFGGAGSRAKILSILVAFVILVVRWGSARRIFILIPKLLLGFGFILGLIYLAAPDVVIGRLNSFQDAFTVALTGEAVEDASATARIGEIVVALPGIALHPIIGNGALSYQWEGGSQSILGEYFFPDDIGLYGVVWEFGVIGLVLFSFQFWFAFRAVRNTSSKQYSSITDATLGYLIYLLFHSITTGLFVYGVEVSLTLIILLQRSTESLNWQAGPNLLSEQYRGPANRKPALWVHIQGATPLR